MNAPEGGGAASRLLVLWAGGCLFGLIAYGALIQAPLDRRALALAKEREPLQETRRALEITVAKLPEFQRELRALEEKQDILKQMLPAERDDTAAAAGIMKAASRTHVDILGVTAGAPDVPQHGAVATPLELHARGRLLDLARFFDSVPRWARTAQLRSVVITRDGPACRARATIAVFSFPPATTPPRKP